MVQPYGARLKLPRWVFCQEKGRSGSPQVSNMPKAVPSRKRVEPAAHRLSSPVKLMSQNYITALEKIWLCVAGELLPSGGVFHGQ